MEQQATKITKEEREGSIRRWLGLASAPGSKDLRSQFNQLGFHSAFFQLSNGGLDVVVHPFQFDVPVFDNRVGRSRVTVTRLADTSRIEDLATAEIEMKRQVSMTDTQEVGIDIRKSSPPGIGVRGEVFIHRIAWRGVNEMKTESIERQRLRDRKLRQVFHVRRSQKIPVQPPGGAGQLPEARAHRRRNSLCDRMIVISPNRIGRVGSDPIDAGDWVHSVFDQIAQKQTGVEGFANGTQGWPVRVDIGENEDFHLKFNLENPRSDKPIHLDG